MQQALLIPDRFTDWRMWAGLPDRLARRAEVSHLDQLASILWDSGGAVVSLARSLRPDGWDVAVAAGRAAALAVALGAAGLAGSIALAEPEIPFDCIPEDIEVAIDPPGTDVLVPYLSLTIPDKKDNPRGSRAPMTDEPKIGDWPAFVASLPVPDFGDLPTAAEVAEALNLPTEAELAELLAAEPDRRRAEPETGQ